MPSYNRIISSLTACVIVFVCSCAPRQQVELEVSKYAGLYPSDLTVEVNHHYALLKWKTNRGDVPIMGYHVYISPVNPVDPDGSGIASGLRPYHDGIYPGDTDPQIEYETFEASDLQDGVEYFAAVALIFPGDQQSRLSNVIEFICHPRGEITLSRSYSGERDGFSFTNQEYVATDALDNQIYFTQIQGEDYLASPSRIDAILPSVRFFPANLSSLDQSMQSPQGSGADKIKVVSSGSCILSTAAGQYAKLIVKGFSGTGDDRRVTLEYSYMPVPGKTDF